MIQGVLAVIWKELKELFNQHKKYRGSWTSVLFMAVVFGIFLPLQSGRSWVESPLGLVYWCWTPFMLVSTVVADSFAGERERHTLETLLASRLSDFSILIGKLSTAVIYGWGLTMICALLGLVTVNIGYGQGHLLLYPWKIGLGILALSFLVSTLAAGLGVLVSLRATTVRQAQQTFSIAFFVLFIPLFLLPALPVEWKSRFVAAITKVTPEFLLSGLAVTLLLINIILILLAAARFKRDKLIN